MMGRNAIALGRAGLLPLALCILVTASCSAEVLAPRPLPPGAPRPDRPPRVLPAKPTPGTTAPQTGRTSRTNALLPIVVQLAQRHLSKVSDKNDMDKRFDDALSRNRDVTDDVLKQLVDGYNAIPLREKQQRFIIPDVQSAGIATTAPLTSSSIQAVLNTAYTGHGKFAGQNVEPGQAVQVARPSKNVNLPSINSISPQGAEPGDTIYIAENNFQEGAKHTVVFDPAGSKSGDEHEVTVSAQSHTKITCAIPRDLYPGEYQIHIETSGAYSDINTFDYEICAPKYRVTFNKMTCVDESRGPNDEKVFRDSLVTFWVAIADESAWSKNSSKYIPFEDGSSTSYSSDDKYVLPPSNSYQEVRRGIVVQAYLYEWNVTSISAQTLEGVVELALEVADEAYDYGGGAWDILEMLAELVDGVCDLVVTMFTKDPVYLGTQQIVYKAPDIQEKVDGGQSITGEMSFNNDDATGSYKLSYTISRK